ncbi:MAG: flagellar basal-body MS-ring/collar protein FliF, partial [Pseudomonadota bacterium]
MFKLASVWNEMSASRKAILVAVLAATLIVFSAVMNVATKPRMTFLYGGLDASAAGDVLSALEGMDVDAEVRGDAIYVPENRRDSLRMALARQGLPQQGQPGFELLDELNGFATTSEMFDAAYWRAKEGELARTLLATPGVKSARVHIAVPKASSFARNRRPPSASATITMSRGRLDMQQATAMRYLIALAVPDMQAEQVAIIDSVNGVVLKPGASDPMIQAEGDSADRETRLEASLMDLLEARVGPGNARVTVSLDIDRERETVSERILDPESRVMMGRETTDMQQSDSGGASGAVTVASNLPEGDAAGNQTQSSSSRSETNETTRFDISEVQRQREKLPGAVSRVHVAVLINDVPGADGAAPLPRADSELESIRELVAASVGFDEARGDIVTVKSMPFHEFEAIETPEESGGAMLWAQQNAMSILQIVIPAIVVIVLAMFVLKPVLTQDIAGATAIADASGAAGGAPLEVEVAPMVNRTPLEELRDLSSSEKDATTTLLKEWL